MPTYKSKRKLNGKPLYYAKVNYTDASGKPRQQRTKDFATKKEAELAEQELLNELKTSERYIATFDEIYNDYIVYQKDKVKLSTQVKYPQKYKHIKPYLGKTRLDKLTLNKYQDFLNSLRDKGLGFVRRKDIHKFVKQLVNFANKMYGIRCDAPMRIGIVSDPNERKKEMKFFTYEEFKTFISAFDNEPIYRPLFKLLYFEGLRIGEALGLRWVDIDLKQETLHVQNTLTIKIKGIPWLLTPPKTKGSDRILPLDSDVLNELKELKKYYKKMDEFKEDWFVFGGARPISENTVAIKKNKKIEETGVKQIRLHDFRHSCASYYIHLGAQPILISKLLGHSSVTMTLNTYSHMYPNQIKEIMELSEKYKKQSN